MDKAQSDALRSVAFFSSLDQSVFDHLKRQSSTREFSARELIIGQDDESFDVLFLLSGLARVNIYSLSGQRISFRDIQPGAIFGELSAIDGQRRSASVECVEPCAVTIMRRDHFLQALADHPQFMMAVMKHLTSQVRGLTTRVVEFSTLDVRNRVRSELLRRGEQAAKGANEVALSPPPTHAEIASKISTHREAITRELSWLSDHGFIVKEGRSLKIINLERLRDLIDDSLV